MVTRTDLARAIAELPFQRADYFWQGVVRGVHLIQRKILPVVESPIYRSIHAPI